MRTNFQSITRRNVRRHIQLALAGAALGTVCMALPSHAADVHVNNTASSGTGSLSQAITDGGHVVFDSPLTNGTQFTSSLPSITSDANSLTIDSTSGLSTLTVSDGLTTDDGGELYLTGDGYGGNYSITSDLTAQGGSSINISNAYTVNGNLAADDQSSIYVNDSTVNGATVKATNGGYIDIYGESTVNLTGDATANGAENGDNSEIDVYSTSTLNAANLNVTNGGYVDIDNDSTVNLTGDANVNGTGNNGDNSKIDVYGTSTLNAANLNVTNGGYVDIYESTVNLTGDANVNGSANNGDDSEIDMYDSTLHATNLNVTNGGYVDIEDGSTVTLSGDATVDGVGSSGNDSEIYVYGGSALDATNLNVTNGGYVDIYDSSSVTLTNNATVDGVGSNGDSSDIDVFYDSALIASNLNITNGGYVDIYDGSALILSDGSGTVTVDGVGSDEYPSELDIEDDSILEGNAVVSNGGYLYIDGDSAITGDVTINANSLLRSSYGENRLNTAVGGGTTTFNANSIFAPNILADPLSVDSLVVNNTAQIRPWLDGSYSGEVPVGSAYGRGVIDYTSISGSFDPTVISPLDVGVEYADSEGTQTSSPNTEDSGEVQLYLKSNQVDFNKLSGSENAHSLGSFLNNVINDSNTNPNYFTLENLPTQLQGFAAEAITDAGYYGDLNSFDEGMPTNYSSHNAQAYWNQKSFVDSILASLNNDNNTEDGGHAFALNQMTSASGAGAQLASLRQALTTNVNRLGYTESSHGNSNGVWAAYNGNHQHTDGDSGIGSNDWSSSSDGFALGYTGGSDSFSWGVAVGHQKSTLDFDDLDASGEQRGWNAGLYASWKGKSAYLSGVLGYGNYDNDSSGDFGDASFKTKATSAALELGKHLSNSKSGSLTPYASVLWTRVKQGDATADGDVGLTLNSGSNSIFATQLGLRYNHRMYDQNGALKGGWQAGAAWLHQGGDTGFPVNLGSIYAPDAGTFAVQSTPLDGNSLVVQLGVYGRIHGNLVGFGGYQGTFGSNQKINAVNAGIGYQF